ncbi:MAG: hypothetical protein ACRC9X_06350 [Bacteroidales bacterium]
MNKDIKILRLVIKRQWLDLIRSGEKKEEYREVKPYYVRRIAGKKYDAVELINGYGRECDRVLIECDGITVGMGVEKWGAVQGTQYYVITLGKILNMDKQ